MSSELLKWIVVTVVWALGIYRTGSVNSSLDKIAVRKLLINAIKHLLMTTFLLINLIPKVHVALMVLIHSVPVPTVEPLIALARRFVLRLA